MDILKTGRIIAEHRQMYVISAEGDTFLGEVSGKFLFITDRPADFPKVGDSVEYIRPEADGRAVIQALKKRKTVLSRKVSGDRTAEQVLAVNVEAVFIVTALDHDFSVRRVERYLTLTWESGARPVIVLNKSDLCEDIDAHLLEVEAVAFGVPVCVTSAVTDTGMDCLRAQIRKEETICSCRIHRNRNTGLRLPFRRLHPFRGNRMRRPSGVGNRTACPGPLRKLSETPAGAALAPGKAGNRRKNQSQTAVQGDRQGGAEDEKESVVKIRSVLGKRLLSDPAEEGYFFNFEIT